MHGGTSNYGFRRMAAVDGKNGRSAITRNAVSLFSTSKWNVKVLPTMDEVMAEPGVSGSRFMFTDSGSMFSGKTYSSIQGPLLYTRK